MRNVGTGYQSVSYGDHSPMGRADSVSGMRRVHVMRTNGQLHAANWDDHDAYIRPEDIADAIKRGDTNVAVDGESIKLMMDARLITKGEALEFMKASNKHLDQEIQAGNDPEGHLSITQQSLGSLAKNLKGARQQTAQVDMALRKAGQTSNLTGLSLG